MNVKSFFFILSSMVLIVISIIYLQSVLIPIAYAMVIALTLFPLVQKLEKKRFPKSIAIILPIILISVFIAFILFVLTYELVVLSTKFNALQPNLENKLTEIQIWLDKTFHWSNEMQFNWLQDTLLKNMQSIGMIIQNLLQTFSYVLFYTIIITIYIYLLLYYRKKLVDFFLSFFEDSEKEKISNAIFESVKMFAEFIKGMIAVYFVVAVLNTIGLWFLGVENPVFYGILTSMMTIIPYVGIIVSSLLPISISWISTGDLWQPLGIVFVFAVVQYLEANLIFPYIVGRKINLNTLVSLLSIFCGGLIWGVSGMILFLPMVAIFRIFASHFENLKNWTKFLGND